MSDLANHINVALKAEVERLRAGWESVERIHDGEAAMRTQLDAYRAAVAEVRAKCKDVTLWVAPYQHREERQYGAHKFAETVLKSLDKLPRDEP